MDKPVQMRVAEARPFKLFNGLSRLLVQNDAHVLAINTGALVGEYPMTRSVELPPTDVNGAG
jgi:hypothetical protein